MLPLVHGGSGGETLRQRAVDALAPFAAIGEAFASDPARFPPDRSLAACDGHPITVRDFLVAARVHRDLIR